MHRISTRYLIAPLSFVCWRLRVSFAPLNGYCITSCRTTSISCCAAISYPLNAWLSPLPLIGATASCCLCLQSSAGTSHCLRLPPFFSWCLPLPVGASSCCLHLPSSAGPLNTSTSCQPPIDSWCLLSFAGRLIVTYLWHLHCPSHHHCSLTVVLFVTPSTNNQQAVAARCRLLRECLTAACKALSHANAKGRASIDGNQVLRLAEEEKKWISGRDLQKPFWEI